MPIRWLTAFFDLPAEAPPTSCTFWQRVTGSTVSPQRGSRAEFATLIPEGGDQIVEGDRRRARVATHLSERMAGSAHQETVYPTRWGHVVAGFR